MNVMKSKYLCMIAMIAIVLSSCSVSRHLPENGYLLDEVKVLTNGSTRGNASLRAKVRQKPNIRTFGLVRFPLAVYCLSGKKDNLINRTLRNIGEAPRVYNDTLARKSCEVMEQALINQGYLKAEVDSETKYKGYKAKVNYYAQPGKRYHVSSVRYLCLDTVMLGHILADSANSPIKVGMPFDANVLNNERARLATLLQEEGYYGYKREYITYIADTARNSTDVALSVRVRSGAFVPGEDDGEQLTYKPWKKFSVDRVRYLMYPLSHSYPPSYVFPDTIDVGKESFLYDGLPPFRFSTVRNASYLEPGMTYDLSKVKRSYASYGRLGALRYTNINFVETTDSTLDCYIALNPEKKASMSTEMDFTNTAGDVGVSASLSLTHRNLFFGSETFVVKLRGAYENITHLTDYESGKFLEYGVDMSLSSVRSSRCFIIWRIPSLSVRWTIRIRSPPRRWRCLPSLC